MLKKILEKLKRILEILKNISGVLGKVSNFFGKIMEIFFEKLRKFRQNFKNYRHFLKFPTCNARVHGRIWSPGCCRFRCCCINRSISRGVTHSILYLYRFSTSSSKVIFANAPNWINLALKSWRTYFIKF